MNTEEPIKQLESIPKDLNDLKKKSLLSYIYSLSVKEIDDDLLLFTKKFASLTGDGMHYLSALKTLSIQIENKTLKKIITNSIPEIESGIPLHVCLRRHNDIFNNIYCDLIRNGEESGRIDQVLKRLSNLLESSIEVEKRVKEALFFPPRFVVVAIFEVIFLLTYIIPFFTFLYRNYYKPQLTLKVFELSSWFQGNILYILGTLLIFFVSYYILDLTKFGKFIFDFIKIKLPVFGNLIRKYTMILYSRNLVTLFNSGITIITSMKTCNETVQNLYLKRKLEQVVSKIENGSQITEAFKLAKFMPKKTINIIETGEEYGYIDEMFTEIANSYEKESLIISKQIMSLLKPVYISIMAIIFGIIIIAMFLPLYYALIKLYVH